MTTLKRHALAALCLLLLPLTAAAQSTTVAFGSGERDPDAPIEVESDNLEVIEANNTAEFTGNVIVVQEAMTLTAPRLLVIYSDDQSRVERMEATGGVTFVNGAEAAEPPPPPTFVAALQQCIRKLPRLQRGIIEADLRSGDVANATELARRYRTSVNSIYVSRSNARKALRRGLQELGFEDGDSKEASWA